jgi:hypothetical protein
MTNSILSHVIAGHDNIWSHPQFLAFRRGFNLEFLGLNGVIGVGIMSSLLHSRPNLLVA